MPTQDDRSESHVYRIIVPTDWQQALTDGHVPLALIDRTDGYIHLSPRSQVLQTAALYFTAEDRPSALKIDAAALGSALVWEPVAIRGGRLFPHLYSDTLPLDVVAERIELKHNYDGTFSFGRALYPEL